MAAGAGGSLETLAQLNAWVDSQINPKPPADPPIRAGTIRARPASVADEFMIPPEDYWRRKVNSKAKKPPPLPPSLHLRPGVAFDLAAFKAATGLNNYKQVDNTGCGKNDCLIISFLTSINENYRRATYDQQCAIANAFRRRELPRLTAFNEQIRRFDAQDRNQVRRGLPGTLRRDFVNMIRSTTSFLDDRVIGILADQYSVSILFLESYKMDRYPGIPGGVAAPPYSSLAVKEVNGEIVSREGIIIYNLGGGHFQSVFRVPDARPTFVFPTEDLQMLQMSIQDAIPFVRREATEGVAGYPPGTEVRLDGNPDVRYWVKGRRQRDNIMPGEAPQILDYTITPIQAQAQESATHASNIQGIAPGRVSLPGEEGAGAEAGAGAGAGAAGEGAAVAEENPFGLSPAELAEQIAALGTFSPPALPTSRANIEAQQRELNRIAREQANKKARELLAKEQAAANASRRAANASRRAAANAAAARRLAEQQAAAAATPAPSTRMGSVGYQARGTPATHLSRKLRVIQQAKATGKATKANEMNLGRLNPGNINSEPIQKISERLFGTRNAIRKIYNGSGGSKKTRKRANTKKRKTHKTRKA
jgi:hypothetical protein